MVGGTPLGDALPSPPQRATLARKGARCQDGAGSARPHRSQPGHAGCAPRHTNTTEPPHGGRTAPSQVGGNRDRTAPPRARQTEQGPGAGHAEGHGPRGTALPAPSAGTARGAHATPARGGGADAAGARAHTHAKSTRGLPEGQPHQARGTHRPRGMAYQRARVRDTRTGRPATRSTGQAGREGGDGRDTTPGTGPSPPNRRRAPRTHGRHTAPAKAVVLMPPPQRARARAVALVTGPHARTPRTHSQWVVGPGCTPERTRGRGWECARPRTPHTQARGAPPGHPHAAPTAGKASTQERAFGVFQQRRPQGRPHRSHLGPTARGTLAARSRGRAAGRGTAPDTRRSSQHWQATPPGDGFPPPPPHAAPAGHAGQGDSVGPPHPHIRAHSTWVADPNSPPGGRAVRGGTAPDLRRPSQWWKAPPPGTPLRHPHSEQRRPARAHAVGPLLGPHAGTDRIRDTRVAEPWLPAPEDRRPGEGQRLTPDAPHNGGRPPPPGTAPHHPRGTQSPQGMQAKGTVLGPHTHTPAPTARRQRTPTARPVGGQSGEGQRLTSDAPHNNGRHPLRGRPSTTPTASNAGPQGRTLWGRCWVPTPAPAAPGTHGLRNPGRPLQRTGGRGRDSA